MDTVPKVIDFPRYNKKCSWENVILRGIFQVLFVVCTVLCIITFSLLFMLYREIQIDFLTVNEHKWRWWRRHGNAAGYLFQFNLLEKQCGIMLKYYPPPPELWHVPVWLTTSMQLSWAWATYDECFASTRHYSSQHF